MAVALTPTLTLVIVVSVAGAALHAALGRVAKMLEDFENQ